MTRLIWLLAVVLVCAGCGSVDIPAPDEMYDDYDASLLVGGGNTQAQVERVLLECPQSERIPLRSPMTGEPGVIIYYDQPTYIAVEDVEEVVRRMLLEQGVIRAAAPIPGLGSRPLVIEVEETS